MDENIIWRNAKTTDEQMNGRSCQRSVGFQDIETWTIEWVNNVLKSEQEDLSPCPHQYSHYDWISSQIHFCSRTKDKSQKKKKKKLPTNSLITLEAKTFISFHTFPRQARKVKRQPMFLQQGIGFHAIYDLWKAPFPLLTQVSEWESHEHMEYTTVASSLVLVSFSWVTTMFGHSPVLRILRRANQIWL